MYNNPAGEDWWEILVELQRWLAADQPERYAALTVCENEPENENVLLTWTE
jgi:hypothetical protein